jgi:histidinol dehydrogenase
VLVSVDGFDLKNLHEEIDQQLEKLSRRDIAKNALENSVIVKVHSVDEAVIVSNLYAPEHLIIQTKKPRKLLENVTNAGSVFLGKWTPESLGDYASGTNHTLPTYGYARMYSGVSLQSYLKFITVQKADKDGILKLGPTVQTMADVEGLDAHKNAVTIRLEALKMNKS